MNKKAIGAAVGIVVIAGSLSACGGGGGGGVESTPPPPKDARRRRLHPRASTTPPPPPLLPRLPTGDRSAFDTAEYRSSNYAVAADALAAYNAGATGKGVKIGIVDTGLNGSLSEFAGRIDPASGDVAGKRGISDEDGHGTAVTAVAAAGRNGTNTMGVAFEATSSTCAPTSLAPARRGRCQFYDDAIAAGIDAADSRASR